MSASFGCTREARSAGATPNKIAVKPQYQGKPIDVAGLFIGRHDVNYIALLNDRDDEGLRVVFHEYAHLITSNVARNLPVWISEGLAEFYSTYRMTNGGREALIGAPVTGHIVELRSNRLLPLAELVGARRDSPLYNENNRRSVLYAQSWALTHMLLLGEPARAPRLGDYLSKVDQGVPASNAWNQVFANDPVERDLKRYIGQSAFRATQYKFSEKLATFEATPTPLNAADAEAFLADILLQQGRTAEAAARLAKISAERPWPATVAALLQAANKKTAEAEKILLGLAAPDDWLTAYRAESGLVELLDEREPSAAHLSAARRLFEATRVAGRETPNATARLIELELSSTDPSVTPSRTAIERARMMAPGRDDYIFLHARVLARVKSYAGARTLVGPMMSPVQPPQIREYARSLMGYIGDLERVDAARAAGASTAPVPNAPGDLSREGNRQPAAGELRADFRKTQPDEQRIEGVLERIECASNSVTFHVRGADPSVRLNAPNLTGIDFITYRDDLTGNISCGPLKEPARVYVTSRAGTAAAERMVVAIEFLPK